jgi:hypothetical protein
MNSITKEELERKIKYLGYKKGQEQVKIDKQLSMIEQNLRQIKDTNFSSLQTMSLEEIKKEAVRFYQKYFDVHDIITSSRDDLNSIGYKISKKEIDALEAYKAFYEMQKEISPFELPIKLVDGHSMIGEVKKPLMIIPDEAIPKEIGKFIPFEEIELGSELTPISAATLIHEISHTQQESQPGYAESILNKEVISIFLEKLSALELDPSGKLLKASEQCRFQNLKESITTLQADGVILKLDDETRLTSSIYIQSTLLAEKLFDLYIRERKQKKKDSYIYNIQDVFDGKITVEELLKKHTININQGKDLSLIKRHL